MRRIIRLWTNLESVSDILFIAGAALFISFIGCPCI